MAQAASDRELRYDDWPDPLVTGEAVALEVRPAGFGIRVASGAIDAFAHFVVYLATVIALSVPLSALSDAAAQVVEVVLLVAVLVAAPIAEELLSHGKSLGRLALGTRIVRDDGGAAGFRHALIRALMGFIEIYSTLGGLAVVVGLFNGRSKRLGDLLAGTHAQYERVRQEPPANYGVPLTLGDWARTADAARLPDQLARRVRQFLEQAAGLEPARRAWLARALALECSPYVSPLPAVDPELFLAGVSVLRREREARGLAIEAALLARLRPVTDALPHGFPDRD